MKVVQEGFFLSPINPVLFFSPQRSPLIVGEIRLKNRMREIRFQMRLTLADLWLKTRIHQSKLSQIERGIFQPTPLEKTLISKALKKSQEEVFIEDQENENT